MIGSDAVRLAFEATAARRRLAFQNGRQLPIPELHGGLLLGIVTVPIVHARDVFLFRVIENAADHKARHATARHQTRRGPTEIVTTDVGLVASAGLVLRLAHNVCTRALRKTAPDVLVIA